MGVSIMFSSILIHAFLMLQDCELLYLNDRPEKLVITNISVPPMALRPSVFVDGGIQRSVFSNFSMCRCLFSILTHQKSLTLGLICAFQLFQFIL